MYNLNCFCAEDRRFDPLFGWLRATQHCGCNKWLPACRWLQSSVNLHSYSNLQPQNWTESYSNLQSQNWSESCEEVQKKIIIPIQICLSKNDNIQIHQCIEMSQDWNTNKCSCLVIFMYWANEDHTFNAKPTERLQQHPLVFAMNRTYCTFFLWRLHLAPPSIGGFRGGLRGLNPPLNFFRYVFWSMVPDTETSIGMIFCIVFK